MSKVKLLICFTVLVDIIGIGIVVPTLPFYVTSLGVRPLVVALLFAVYSLCSFVSSPFLGALSDRIGRRPILIISILSTAIGWFVFAASRWLPLLFLGRIIDGLAAGNISTAQSCLVDVAKDDKERSANLGLIGAMFGIGFIIGPLLGGILGHYGQSLPFWFAAGLSFVNVVLAMFFLPETHTKRDHAYGKLKINPFSPLFRALRNKKLLPSYTVWLLFGLGAMSVHSIFALYLGRVFHLGALAVGVFFGCIGLIISFNQGVGLKHFWLKKFREPDLAFIMVLIYAFAYLLMSVAYLWLFVVGLVVTAFCQSILRVVITSQVVAEAEPHAKGEALGILNSVMAVSMIVSPAISGVIFEYKENSPFILGSMYMFLALGVIYYHRRKLAKLTLPEDTQVPTGM